MGKKYDELFSSAQFAFLSQQYDTVYRLCKQALAQNPELVGAYSLAGNARLLQNRFEEAQEMFQQAIALDPETGEHYFCLGNCMFGRQRFSEAMELYAKALQCGCGDEAMKKIYYLVGLINQLDGKPAEALMNYDKSEAIEGANDDRADMLLKKTQIYVENHNYEMAENCALQLKLLMPNVFKSYQLLFQLYLELRKLDEADAILDEAERSCEQDVETRMEISFDRAMLCCFRAEQDQDNQERHYGKALEILAQIESDPQLKREDRCEAATTRADIYFRLQRFSEAEQLAAAIAEEALPSLTEYVEKARYTMVRCLSHRKDYAGVQSYAKELKKSANPFYSHFGYYSEAYAAKQLAGDTPDERDRYLDLYAYAIAHYRNCTLTNPGDFLAYLFRAKCYVDIGRYDEAMELCEILPADGQKTLKDYIKQERGV